MWGRAIKIGARPFWGRGVYFGDFKPRPHSFQSILNRGWMSSTHAQCHLLDSFLCDLFETFLRAKIFAVIFHLIIIFTQRFVTCHKQTGKEEELRYSHWSGGVTVMVCAVNSSSK